MSSVFRLSTLFILIFFQAGSIAYVSAADVSKYLQDASRFIDKGEYRSAVIQLKNVLQQDKDNAEARLMLGKVYLEVGHGPGAEKELEIANKLGAKDPYLNYYLGKAYLLQGETKKILEAVKAPDTAPALVRAAILALKGDAFLQQQKKTEAQTHYAQSLEMSAKNVYGQTGMARLAVLDNKQDEAMSILDSVLAADGKNIDALSLKANIYRRKADMSSAEAIYTTVLEYYPENVNALVSRGVSRITQKKMQLAEADIEGARKLAPNHPIANYLRAMLDFQANKIASAQDLLQLVLKSAPNYPPPYMLLGAIQYGKQEYEQAEYNLSQFVKYSPGHLPANKLLAATYIKRKQPAQAIKTLEGLVNRFPKDAQLLAMLGSAHMQNGDVSKGTEYLQQAADIAPDIASIRTQLALGHLAEGKGEQAEAELETAVDMGQGVYQADIMLVLLHLKKKEFDKALATIDKLQQKIPENPMPLNLKGAAYLGKQDIPRAREQFELALKLKPDFSVAAMNLAKLDLNEKKPAQAKNRFLNILKHDATHVGAMLGLAGLAEQDGDKAGAVKWLETAREKAPRAIEPRLLLVRYYLGQGKANKALTITREMLVAHPDHPLVLKTVGTTQAMAGESASAIANFEKLGRLVPQSPEPHVLIAGELYKQKDYKGAADQYSKALQLKPDYLPAEIGQVLVAMNTNQNDKAVSLATNIQKAHPDSAAGFKLEGDIHLKRKHYADAVKAYTTAYAKGKNAQLAAGLYHAHVQNKHPETGFGVLESWLKDNPGDLSIRMLLAGGYQTAGNNHEAIKQYTKILERQPKNIIALNNLAWLYQDANKPDALGYAEKAYALTPDKPAVMDTLGWVLIQNGKVERGLVILQEAVSKAPHLPEIRYHMAVALHKSGRSDEAKKELSRLIRGKQNFSGRDNAIKLLEGLK